ncbi:MAG TPA: hypothetical protein VNX02_10080 [Steroidobacteraceae bacterium]|nr:hypothetical protein [Steroidobacteraceae bacterium]
MGSFYVNVTVRGPTQEDVIAAVSERAAYVSQTIAGCTVILDESCESQLEAEIITFAAVLSYRLHCPAFSAFVHDDDIFVYWLHRDGALLDIYNSNPGAFAPPGMTFTGPVGGNASLLASTFEVAESTSLSGALQTPHGAEKYNLETNRHRDLAEALGLPAFSAGLGYSYLQRGDTPGAAASTFYATLRAAANNRWRGP